MKVTTNKGVIHNIEGSGTEHCCECRHKTNKVVHTMPLPMCDINKQILRQGSYRHRWCRKNEYNIGIIVAMDEEEECLT